MPCNVPVAGAMRPSQAIRLIEVLQGHSRCCTMLQAVARSCNDVAGVAKLKGLIAKDLFLSPIPSLVSLMENPCDC